MLVLEILNKFSTTLLHHLRQV